MQLFFKIQYIVILFLVWSLWGQIPSNLDLLQGMVSQPVLNAVDSLATAPVSIDQRRIETLLTFYIKNNRESILYTYSKRNEQKNVLSKSQIDQVENNFFSFSEGQKIESGIVNKLIEPAIITIDTAGVIYLFFSLKEWFVMD